MPKTEHSFQGDGLPTDELYAQLFGPPALTQQRREAWLKFYAEGLRKPRYADLKARALRAGASASRQLGEGGKQT